MLPRSAMFIVWKVYELVMSSTLIPYLEVYKNLFIGQLSYRVDGIWFGLLLLDVSSEGPPFEAHSMHTSN